MNENIIDKEFTNQIIELENGWIETPNGIFTPNEELGLSAYEVYENYLYNLNNPPILQLTLEEKVQLQEDKISILTEQNNQQEEIIASLTYELMMLQEPIALATLNNNHSPKYNLIKSWFNKGYWNEDILLNAVDKHYITEEEMNEIIG